MQPCKAILPDGKLCPNQADEGQEFCPFHLADQITMPKKILSVAIPILGVVASVVVAILKLVDSSKRE